MKLFDCYCGIGELALPPPKYSKTAHELLDEMEFCSIEEAIVWHHAMRFGSPIDGNRMIIEETADYSNIYPAWTILPYQTGEQSQPANFFKEMKEHNVKVLFAFPKEHGYILDSVVFGELLEAMVERSVPLFIKPDWPLIYSVLNQFPSLTLIAVGHGPHGQDRYFRPLIEKYPRFYLDTSGYLQDGGIESFCKRYGPERLLFSTGYPGNCIGGPVLRILTAEIDDSHKELIANGNIKRILKEVSL